MVHRRADRLPGGRLDQAGQAVARAAQEHAGTIRAEDRRVEADSRLRRMGTAMALGRSTRDRRCVRPDFARPISQSLAMPSSPAVRISRPSGENAATVTPSRCRRGEPMGRPVATSHSRAV